MSESEPNTNKTKEGHFFSLCRGSDSDWGMLKTSSGYVCQSGVLVNMHAELRGEADAWNRLL